MTGGAGDEAWARFRAAPTTLGPTPGVREAWARGRTTYGVWLLRVDDAAIAARLALVADRLAAHGVPRPFTEPHVTVFVAGFPTFAPIHDDDADEGLIVAQAEALREAAPRAPPLWVGGLNAFLSCAILDVSDPDRGLDRLRAPLAAAAREIRFAPYEPHLTVGVFADTRPTGPVAAAIAPLRALPPLPLQPRALEFVTFEATEPGSPLRTRLRVDLG